MRPIETVLSKLENIREETSGYRASCPVEGHGKGRGDLHPSLSVSEAEDGRALVRCGAGCSTERVLEHLGLWWGDLFPENGNGHALSTNGSYGGPSKPRARLTPRRVTETYDYTDEAGKLLFQVVRFEPKGFSQRRPDRQGGWITKGVFSDMEPVFYRLPRVLEAARSGGTVYIPEGEKDVHRLEREGLTATTSPMGACKWRESYSEALKGVHAVILPDNDEPGRKHARMVAESLHGNAASVKVVELPGLPERGDVSDWLDGIGTVEELLRLIEDTPEYSSPASSSDGQADSRDIRVVGQDEATTEHGTISTRWPTLAQEAYHGLPGEIVRAIEPHTEADPVAVLMNLLVAFGNAAGRGAFLRVGADYHRLNLYAAFVGETAKGRKGMSWGHVKELMHAADPDWVDERRMNGLSSGEGLIYAVRDRITGENKHGEPIVVDEGVKDKRLFVIEGEFASVLKVMSREGNTLSPITRQGWDGDRIQVLTKNNPIKATDAHISIVGHITRTELLRHLTGTESANGFANRFIWLLVKRSKVLPFGGRWDTVDTAPLVKRLRYSQEFARDSGEIGWGEGAREVWREVYPMLSEGEPGLFGAVTGRAEAQVVRLAAVYAVMDQSRSIEREHLEAGLALWDYAEESARYIFGDAVGDSAADTILEALKAAGKDGMSRTEIRDLFGRNKNTERINQALALLLSLGRAYKVPEETGGRPAERWFAR